MVALATPGSLRPEDDGHSEQTASSPVNLSAYFHREAFIFPLSLLPLVLISAETEKNKVATSDETFFPDAAFSTFP